MFAYQSNKNNYQNAIVMLNIAQVKYAVDCIIMNC